MRAKWLLLGNDESCEQQRQDRELTDSLVKVRMLSVVSESADHDAVNFNSAFSVLLLAIRRMPEPLFLFSHGCSRPWRFMY